MGPSYSRQTNSRLPLSIFRLGALVLCAALLAACGGGANNNNGGNTGGGTLPPRLTGGFNLYPLAELHYQTPTQLGLTNTTGEFIYASNGELLQRQAVNENPNRAFTGTNTYKSFDDGHRHLLDYYFNPTSRRLSSNTIPKIPKARITILGN